MILIGESGSTKCNWVLCSNIGKIILKCNTIGFNPYFIESNNIISNLKKTQLVNYKTKINTVFFYGAGCSSIDMNKIIYKALILFFQNAKIEVKHDLYAACYALYNNKPNITCILGTGSNSCYFDGKNIIQNTPSLGFIIGDEGSGNYFGKKILQLYFNKKLSKDLNCKFENNYQTNWLTISKNIYGNNQANVYLANYFSFLLKNKNAPEIKNLIYHGIRKFFEVKILCFNNYNDYEINFVGSVAYFLSKEIHNIAKEYNCKICYIVKNPIEKLIKFHFQN